MVHQLRPQENRDRSPPLPLVMVALSPYVLALIATVLYLFVGFGGGHGRADGLIMALGLPGNLLLDQIPWPAWGGPLFDLIWLVWVPAFVNSLATSTPLVVWWLLRARKGTR